MADGVDIDLYSDDIDQSFGQIKEEYGGDDDLYDDVVAAPSSEPHERTENENGAIPSAERSDGVDSNGGYMHIGNNAAPNHVGRRHQLYVGNLTWWTTDQDITDAVASIGVSDFQEVKFFENRANGQSKGFCVISLGSESSMRMCMDRLSKNELHGQKPIVTLPTKQALNQFESQQKTRPIPPTTNAPRGQAPMQGGPMQGGNFNGPPGSQGHPPRMMMPNGPPGGYRPQHMPPQNMQGGMGPNQGPPRMQAKISALKELVRKSESDQGKNTANAQEKVRNIAQRLTHLKTKATRSRQSEKSFGEIQEEAGAEPSTYENEPIQIQRATSMQSLPNTPLPTRARSETPGSEKIQLLRQQMEQNRLKMAERETSKRGIEQLVTQLKAKFDSSQQSLDRAHLFGSSVGDLSSLPGASAPQPRHQSTGDLSGAFNLDRERIKYLEKRVRHLESEMKQKETDFLTKDPESELLKTIKTLEEKVMDLEENLKEKDNIIAARTQAASLITESLSLKGRDTVDLLEETKQEMYKMQSNFVAAEDDFKQHISKLEKELQTKEKRIANLEEVNDILETARFDLTLKNSELDSKTGNVEDYVIKLNELNRINETLQHRIEELENEKEAGGDQSTGATAADDEAVVQATIEQTLKIQSLEGRIAELQSENDDLKKSLQNAVNVPTTDESAQDKINALEATIEAQKADCLNLSNTLQTIQEQLQEKTVEYNVLMANFSVLEEKLKSYGPKSLFSKSGGDEAQAEINKLSKQLDDANKAGIKTKLKMKQLQKQIDAFKKASDTNRELVKLSDENQRLSEKIRDLETELLVQSSRLAPSEADEEGGIRRDSMASEKSSLPATELEAKIKLLETTCQNQTSAIQLLEEQKLDMTADLNTTRTELSSLKGQISSIDKQEVTSQIDSIVLEEQFEENLREVEKLKQKINELMAEKADLKTRLDHYIAENMELLDKIEKLSKGSSVESIEILERLTHDERLEMERFQHQSPRPSSITEEDGDHGEDHVDKQRRDSAPVEAEIGSQEHSNDEYLDKIAALSEENVRNVSLIEELRAEREKIESECEELRAKHLSTLEQLKELQEDRQNLLENVNEINDIKTKLQAEIEVLTKERAEVEERRKQRDASELEAAIANDGNTYEKTLTSLNAELENYRTAKDKSSKANASKKLAREAKNVAEMVERLIQDKDRSIEMYESLKCEVDVAELARESQERSRLEAMAALPDEDIEQLHDEINRYKEIESDLQQRCAELEQQIEHEHLDKDELKRSLEEITEKSNEIESSLKEENDRLNRQLQEVESKLNDANEYTFQELQKQRKEFDNLMETNKKEVDILHELVEEQKQQLITAYTEHEDELQKKMQQIADYGSQIQRLQAALDETSEQMSKANDTYAAGLTEKVDSMKLLLDENQKILDEQTADLSHKQATIETLNQQIMDLYATMEHQTAELNEKEEEINELQKTIDQNRIELKKMNQNALAAERRAKEAETYAKKLAIEFDEAKAELETKNKEQLDKLKKFAANLKKRNAQYAELEQKYAQFEATKSEVAATMEPTVVERKIESVALEQSSAQLDELKETVRHLESKVGEYEAEVQQLRSDLSHRCAELDNLTLRLSEKATLVDQLTLELDSRNIELNDLRNKMAELPTEEDVKAKSVKIEKCKAIIKEKNKEIKRLKELVETASATAAPAAEISGESGESTKLQLEQLQSEKEKAESDYMNYRTCIEAELQRNELVLESMEAENAQLKERIGRLEESICICEERRSSLERHSEVLGLQLEQKQAQMENTEDELNSRLKALVGQDEIIEQKLNDLETERDALAETVNELRSQQTDLARRHSVLQVQLNELETTKLNDLEAENRLLGEKIERLESELAKQKADSEQALAAKHAELMELENELSDHLQKIEKERRSIQEDLEKARDENESLLEEIGRLRESQSDMERSRSDLEQQMTWMQQQNETMTQDQLEAQELRMQVVQDQTEVEHLHAQNVEMAERHRHEVAQAEAEIERLRRERDDLGREMDALKTQICRDQTEIVALRCSAADHETEVNALQHRINELMALSGQIEYDHSEIESLRANKQQLEAQLAALRQQIADMDSLQMHVGQNLTQDQMEVQQLRTQIGHDQTEIEALRHQLQALQASHETELTALRQQITELDSLRMQVGQNQTDDQVFIQNENERLQALLAEKEIEIQNYQRQNLQLQMSAGAAASNDPFATLSMPADSGAASDARIAELENQLDAAIHEAADRRSKIADLEATIEQLQRSSSERDSDARHPFAVAEPAIITHQMEPLNAPTVAASSFELFESSQQIEDLQRNVSDLEKYVTDLEHKLKSATEENVKLHGRCKQFEDQLAALNVELTAVQERLRVAEAERQIVETSTEVSVDAVAPKENEPVQMTAAMFFGGPAPTSSNPFDYVGNVENESQRVPVVEEVIVPKKAYICQPETLERQALSPFSVEEGWGDTSWGADAALEEEHQRQTVPTTEQAPNQGLSGAEVKLQMDIDQLTSERDILNAELTAMQSKYQKMLKKLREYKTKNEELERTKRASVSAESNELDLAIQQEMSDQIKALETLLKETKAEREKDAQEKKKLLARIDVLTAANDRMIEMKDRQDVEIEVCKTKIRELNGKLEKLSEWSDDTATAASHDDGSSGEIALRLTEAQNQNRLLEERIARLQDSVADKDDFEEEREQLLEKISTLTTEKKLLEESIVTKDEQISMLNSQLSALDSQNNDYRATIDILSVESNNIKTYLDRVKEEHKQKIDENSNLSEKLRELDDRNTELARQVEEMRVYNLNRQDVEQRIQNLTATIQYKDSEIAELKESNENLRQQFQTEIEQLKQALASRDDELRQLREARDLYVAEKEVEETKEVVAPVDTVASDRLELENVISELREEKQQMEEELQVLNDQVLKHLEMEDRIKSTVLELDMKNIEISELKNTIEQLRSQSTAGTANDESNAALELRLSEKETLHQNAIDLLNVQWQQVVDQKCAEVADSWRHHLHTREEELAVIENELREQLAQHSAAATLPVASETPSEADPSTAIQSNADQGDLMKSMQEALESQEMEIVSLKEQLAIRSAEYARIAAAIDPYGQRLTSSHSLSGERVGSVEDSGSSSQPNKGNELDLALYMLHQRDMRCEELTEEVIHLLEERDTLQLKLSNSIRQIEEIKRRTGSTDVSPNSAESSSDNSPVKPLDASGEGASQAIDAGDNATKKSPSNDNLNLKLSELHNVNHSRDKTLYEDRDQRRRQMSFLQRDVANMPPEALAELFGPDYNAGARNNSQNPSSMLLNWLWGKSDGDN